MMIRRHPNPVWSILPAWRAKSSICLLTATIALAAGATAVAASVHVSATKAAQACSEGRAIGSKLGAADTAFLAHLVPCVIKNERAQVGLRFQLSPRTSRMMKGVLAHLFTLSISPSRLKAQARAIRAALVPILVKTCPGSKRIAFNYEVDDTTPPAITPSGFADFFAEQLRRTPAFRSPHAIFGVAVFHGAMFRNRDRDAAALGLVGIQCQ